MLVTLREPAVIPAASPDPLPLFDADGAPIEWTHREAAGLRFERWRAERGDFDGDRFGLAPEPLPPIVRKVEQADHENREGQWP